MSLSDASGNTAVSEPISVPSFVEYTDALQSGDLPVVCIEKGSSEHQTIAEVLSASLSYFVHPNRQSTSQRKAYKAISLIANKAQCSDIQVVGGNSPRLFTEFRDGMLDVVLIQDLAMQFHAKRRDLGSDLDSKIALLEYIQDMKAHNLLGDAMLSFILHRLLEDDEKIESNIRLFGVDWNVFCDTGGTIYKRYPNVKEKAQALSELSALRPGIYDDELLKIGQFSLPMLATASFAGLREIIKQDGAKVEIEKCAYTITAEKILIERTSLWFNKFSGSPRNLLKTALMAYRSSNPV